MNNKGFVCHLVEIVATFRHCILAKALFFRIKSANVRHFNIEMNDTLNSKLLYLIYKYERYFFGELLVIMQCCYGTSHR